MPLVGYLGTTKNVGRISTITSLDGDQNRKKKITSARRVGYVSLMVRDCLTHEPRGAVVPVELKEYQAGTGWVEIGIARCCPLCWRILVAPDGATLPVVKVQGEPKGPSDKQLDALSQARQKRGHGQRKTKRSPLWELLENMITSGEPFTAYDIMELSSKSRTAVRSVIKQLIKQKKLEVVESDSPGISDRTQYRAP